MRTILILSILLGLGTSALAQSVESAPIEDLLAQASASSQKAITVSAHSSPGAIMLTLQDDSDRPFSRPVIRLVPIPPATPQPRVRLLSDDESVGAAVEVSCAAPITIRGLRLLPVTIAPKRLADDGSGKTIAVTAPHRIDVDIRYRTDAAKQPASSAALAHSRGFFESYGDLIPQDQLAEIGSADEGSYLIITEPAFVAAVQPLADWKRAKGLDVIVATTNDTGQDANSIHDYISNLYHTAPVPPEYVLLVGDVMPPGQGGIPAGNFSVSTSDLPYSLLDGNDFFPDVYLGRLSVSNAAEAQTVVGKIVGYEQTPYTQGGTDWFKRGLVAAANYGSSTPVPVCSWCRKELLNMGYSAVDSCFSPPWSGDQLHLIPRAVNLGVSIVIYRGWALAYEGWDQPRFLRENVEGLTNGWKLPVVFNFVCRNNDFNAEQPCFGEVWVRTTDVGQPRGAVAFIGNSEPWSHTRFNDVGAIGTMKALDQGKRRLGEIMNTFKAEWLLQFPAEIPMSGAERESVEYYYYIYNLLGDPEMSMWTAPPTPITVTHLNAIPRGMNYLDVHVAKTAGGDPIVGARVGITQGNVLLGGGWTDAAGTAHVDASFQSTADSVSIVVTEAGVAPYQASVPVADGSFIALEDSGIGGATPSPAGTYELRPILRNMDSATAIGVQGALTAVRGAQVVSGQVSFPDIPPGETATASSPLTIQIDPTAQNGMIANFLLDVSSGEHHSTSDLSLSITAADVRYETSTVDGDGILAPDEIAGLTVTLHNDATMASGSLSAVLRSRSSDLVTVADSTASYASIGSGASGGPDRAFRIHANAEAAIGQVANFTLTLTSAGGQISQTSFSLSIGAADHSAPLGPDTYGYYAYDNTDTDYPDAAPTFEYFTCSTAYGGPGTPLTLTDNSQVVVNLPFTFTFYGKTYSRVAIADNGWLAFDTSTYFDWYNWHLPTTYGSGAKIAAFWDNLDPTMSGRINRVKGDGIYYYYDAANHRFIVEWSRIPNVNLNYDDLQTFEAILYDPTFRAGPTGDGVVAIMYKQISNTDQDRMYATVGIENETKDGALEYTYSNLYPVTASPLGAGLAIRFTTQPPRFRPFGLAHFSATPQGRRVVLSWEPADDRPRGSYRVYRGTSGGGYQILSGPPLDTTVRSFEDPTADADSSYTYKIGSTDPFGRETVVGPFSYQGRLTRVTAWLEARTPNPFRGSMELMYGVPRSAETSIRVFDLAGRLVRTLVEETAEPGIHSVTWDGKDQDGRDLPSGMYLCKLRTGRDQRSLKLTLLR